MIHIIECVSKMEACQYKSVKARKDLNDDDNIEMFKAITNSKGKLCNLPLLRQIFICSGPILAYFVTGVSLGSSTVVLAQLRREAGSDEAISASTGSWLTCLHAYSAVAFMILWANLLDRLGRKTMFILAYTPMLISFIIFYCANNTTELIVGEILRGSGFAANFSITLLVITEYTSPKYRGVFLTIKSASLYWGVWVSNAIGTFFHWKYIGIVAFICFGCMSIAVFWPESPTWLASKGRFEECILSYRWLRGTSEGSEQELEKLIEAQEKYIGEKVSNTLITNKIGAIIKTIAKKKFYKPLLLSLLVVLFPHITGKLVCSLYAVEVNKKITKDESTAFTFMLVLDGITVLGMYIGVYLSKFLKRRTLLFSSTILGLVFLSMMCLYLFFVSLGVTREYGIVTIALLTAFSFCLSIGPVILNTSIYGELIPIQSSNIFTYICGTSTFLLTGSILKVAPFIFSTFSLHNAFFIFLISGLATTFILYQYLPETKDKTILETEEFFER